MKRLNERRRAERDADRLKAEFLSLVSHELRTPLSSVLGYAEVLGREDFGPLTADQRQFVEAIERNAKRLLALVGDLLLVTEIEADRLRLCSESVDLGTLVEEAVEAAGPVARAKGVELTLDVRARPRLAGDSGRLGQVLDNLLSNAIKFTAAGGSVTVTVGQSEERAHFEIEDTGIGIPTRDHDRVFGRFYRSDAAARDAVQGPGLGLSIAKALVEGHGGTIGFTSEEGRGTIFRVELPAPRPEPVVLVGGEEAGRGCR